MLKTNKKSQMTDTLERETKTAEAIQTPTARLMSIAEDRGVHIEGARLDRLVRRAQTADAPDAWGWVGVFREDGLKIAPPFLDDSVKYSRIDFTPETKRSPYGANEASRAELSRITIDALRALQDYAILVDAGYLTEADTIIGYTNPTMAKLATKRLGFLPRGTDPNNIEVQYADMRDRLFSPEVAQMEARLVDFQEHHTATAEVVGPVAVGSSI
jgi:hypothetical protein